MLRGCKSQRPSGEGRLYFETPNADAGRGGGDWHSEVEEARGSRREEGARGKARSSGVWETCVLESKLTENTEEVFTPALFPGTVLGQLSNPSTGQELDHFNSTNQSGSLAYTPDFQSAKPPFTVLSLLQLR